MTAAARADYAEFISHDEFRAGLPQGRFRIVVNPKLARAFVKQRLWLLQVTLPILGIGAALALTGHTWWGGLLVFLGIALNRAVVWGSPRILLHLALHDASVYAFATQHGIMEVQRA